MGNQEKREDELVKPFNKDIWYDYKSAGKLTISLSLAEHAENRDMIMYNLTFPEELQNHMELMEFVLSEFSLKNRHFKQAE